jgi:Lrp/AsnC family transcriptional regulator
MGNIMELDSIDYKILAALQRDATLTVQALGDVVGLSANPCWRRVKRMEESGIIEGRVAVVNAAAVGLGLTAFVAIRTNRHNRGWLIAFGDGVRAIPEIVECHRMSGEIDYMLKVVVHDISHYDDVYQRLIAAVPDLADVSSSFSMEQLKYGTAIDVNTAYRFSSGRP